MGFCQKVYKTLHTLLHSLPCIILALFITLTTCSNLALIVGQLTYFALNIYLPPRLLAWWKLLQLFSPKLLPWGTPLVMKTEIHWKRAPGVQPLFCKKRNFASIKGPFTAAFRTSYDLQLGLEYSFVSTQLHWHTYKATEPRISTARSETWTFSSHWWFTNFSGNLEPTDI